ncbi:MAG: ferrochelatase [Alphaproteobacteria bacterium]|nr:ferrochelatase [Alphaproteobacteria bacterium]
MKKTAVVLFNLGGPSSLEGVESFLFSLFSDPDIISLPNPFRYMLAFLITKRRLREAQHIYSLLGGRSPLLENTKAQAIALNKELGDGYQVFVAMRHAPPLTPHTFEEVKAYGPDEVVLLPLYPQYSTTTTKSSLKAWIKETRGWKIPTRFIRSYPTLPGFINVMCMLTQTHYKNARRKGHPKILLTAHGLPKKTVQKGDPYQQHVEQTAESVIKNLSHLNADFVLCYQSRVGPLTWLGPYTDSEIIKASRENRPLIVVPLSFVSEHSETLVELDVTYRKLALQEGCPAYYRVNTVKAHPLFIKGLAQLVRGSSPLQEGETDAF